MVVLKELIFISFYFGRVWWSWKNLFLTVSTLGEGVKEPILNSFYCRWMWQSRKYLFVAVSTVGRCGGLERSDF